METVILIPAYKPEPALAVIVAELKEKGFETVVVNDGSGSDYDGLFEKVSEYAYVLSYEKNKGKGGALKYGLAHIFEKMPKCRFVVTADADGQHKTDDICAVAKCTEEKGGLVIGSRDFSGKVPLRSLIGNGFSRFVYSIAAGRFLSDNQSGLRGFPVKEIPWMLHVSGDKYDYEMNVLMYAAKKNIEIIEYPIQTVYENNNSCSHFNPLRDTLRIYKKLFATAGISIAALIFNVIVAVMLQKTGIIPEVSIVTAMVASVILAGLISILPGVLPFPIIMFAMPHMTGVSICRTFFRCAVCSLFFRFANMPFWLAYILAVLMVVPGEYASKRLTHFLKTKLRKRRNREMKQ